jgi:hypothetical protein
MDFKKAKKVAELVATAEQWKVMLKDLEDADNYDPMDHYGMTKEELQDYLEVQFEAAKKAIKDVPDESKD